MSYGGASCLFLKKNLAIEDAKKTVILTELCWFVSKIIKERQDMLVPVYDPCELYSTEHFYQLREKNNREKPFFIITTLLSVVCTYRVHVLVLTFTLFKYVEND